MGQASGLHNDLDFFVRFATLKQLHVKTPCHVFGRTGKGTPCATCYPPLPILRVICLAAILFVTAAASGAELTTNSKTNSATASATNAFPPINSNTSTNAATATPAEPEMNLEQLMKMEIPVVEGASKYAQKVTEAPSSVTIITSDDVKKYGHRTLADILRTVPGFNVSYDRDYDSLGVRGFNIGGVNNRVLVLVDGHRINNSLSDSALIGTAFILDVDLIDRVEVIRGPGSSLYGNNAFFGVINVITRKGRDMPGYGAELSGDVLSYDTYQGRVTYGHRFTNGLELMLSGTIYDSEGHDTLFYPAYNTPTQNNGFAQNADNDDHKNFFGSVGYNDFTLEGAFNTREKRNPTAVLLTDFDDNRLRSKDDRSYADLKYAHQFPDLFDVNAQVYYDRTDNTTEEPFGGTVFQDAEVGQWWGTEVQFTKRIGDKHTLTFGGEYRDDFRQDEQLSEPDLGTVVSQVHHNRQNYGIYLEGDFALVDQLHLNAGGRYDQYADFDPSFNPRLALIYNPFKESVIKAMYGTAFRAPSFDELRTSAFQNIQPEKISTYELAYEQGIGEHLRSSVDVYYNVMDSLIFFNSAAGHQRYENLSGADAKGTELSLEGTWGALKGRASYSFVRTYDSSTGMRLTDSPQHLGKLNLSVPVYQEKIFADLEFQFVSSRTTTHIDATGTQLAGEDVPAYGIVNFTLFSQNLAKGLDISASVYNLLDRRYSDPSSPFHQQDAIEQDGRTFRFKLTYRF